MVKTVPSGKMETDSPTVFSHNQMKMAARTKRTHELGGRELDLSAAFQMTSYQVFRSPNISKC